MIFEKYFFTKICGFSSNARRYILLLTCREQFSNCYSRFVVLVLNRKNPSCILANFAGKTLFFDRKIQPRFTRYEEKISFAQMATKY